MARTCTEAEFRDIQDTNINSVLVGLTVENYLLLEAMVPDQKVSQTVNRLVDWYRESCTEDIDLEEKY